MVVKDLVKNFRGSIVTIIMLLSILALVLFALRKCTNDVIKPPTPKEQSKQTEKERISILEDSVQYYKNEKNQQVAYVNTITSNYKDLEKLLEQSRFKNDSLIQLVRESTNKRTETTVGAKTRVRVVSIQDTILGYMIVTDTVEKVEVRNDTVYKTLTLNNNAIYNNIFSSPHYKADVTLGLDTARLDLTVPMNLIINQRWRKEKWFKSYKLETLVTSDNPHFEVRELVGFSKSEPLKRLEIGLYGRGRYNHNDFLLPDGGLYLLGGKGALKLDSKIGINTQQQLTLDIGLRYRILAL